MNRISRINPILETMAGSPERISQIMVQRDSPNKRVDEVLSLARAARIPVVFVPRKHLDRMDRHHQGIIAIVTPKGFASLDSLLEVSDPPFLLLLDGIEDPQNLGAIIRSAEGAGVHGIILPERGAAGLTDAVYSVSAGA